MTNIPEDSMLRRHYLTEWRNNLDKQLLNGLCNQQEDTIETIDHAQPVWSLPVLIPAILFAFFLGVLFL